MNSKKVKGVFLLPSSAPVKGRINATRRNYFPLQALWAADCVGMVLGVGGQTDARMRPHGTGETAKRQPCHNPCQKTPALP